MFERLLCERRGRTELHRVGKNSERVAWNEVTTRAAGGRHGAADSFGLVEAHSACVWGRERKERRVVRFSRGAASFISANPLWTRRSPPRDFLAHYMSLRSPPSPRRSTRNAYTWSRYRARARAHAHPHNPNHDHDHEEKRERERKNDTTSLERAFMERRCQTRRHLIVSFWNLVNKIFEIHIYNIFFSIAPATCLIFSIFISYAFAEIFTF